MIDQADLVVVGYGGAGAATAVTAADAGATVLLLEKQPQASHTPSTRMSGGIVMACTDPVAATEYLDACAGGVVPASVTRTWMDEAAGLVDWFTAAGVELPLQVCGGAEHPSLPGAEAIVTYQPGTGGTRLDPSGGGGPALWDAVAAAVQRRASVHIAFDAPAQRLRRDGSGRVTGVRVRQGAGTVDVRAHHGVVLACGGFEFDPWLTRNYLRTDPVRFYGNPGNTGDGVRMALDVGADLWHMNQMVGRAVGSFVLDDGRRLGFIIGIDPPGYVITDRCGRRFADEEPQARLRHDFYYHLLSFDSERGEYPRNPCFWFFDDRRRAAGPLTYPHIGACGVGLYQWSADNSAEIDRGWIAAGKTAAEAAAAAGCADPEQAERTVAEYNAACERGVDPLGRPPSTLVPIDGPPYYCVPLWAGGSNTSGGPRRNEASQVLDAFGEPIAGLYAAGELGQVLGVRYPADGANLSDAFCFGRIAARHALGKGA